MFGTIVLILLGISFGLGLILKIESFGFLSWAIRYGIDESGRKQQLIGLKMLGELF